MATLYINISDSRCSACNNNADPMESAHLMETMAGTGCGEKFTGVSTYYTGVALEARIKEMRPDLPWMRVASIR